MAKLIASSTGLAKIKQARKERGWNLNDSRWLESASEVLGVLPQEGKFAAGISYGTWKRFLSGKYQINARAFQAYCQVLGLDWQGVIEDDSNFGNVNSNDRDWGEAIDVSVFFGREEELAAIEKYLIEDKCRLVTLLGMGGIGKTALSIKAARFVANKFEFVIWRSLRNAPLLDKILTDLIQFISEQKQIYLPDALEQKISLLLHYLRVSRCLLIFDNVESILQSGQDKSRSSLVTNYQTDYQNYGNLFKAIAESKHQSCSLLTSREQPPNFSAYEGENLPVRTIHIKGLSSNAGQKVLHSKGNFTGLTTAGNTLIEHYGGNPLALKIVSSTIQDFFAGNVTNFIATLQTDVFIFDDIRDLLQEQFKRLTGLERQIMYWLAINREPVSIRELQRDFVTKVSPGELLQSLASLQKRSFIEKYDNFYSLQTVIIEYIIYELIIKITAEISSQEIELLNLVALSKSQSKDYIRESQETQILKPIADKLLELLGTPQQIEKQTREIIQSLHSNINRILKRGYLSGNIINILSQLNLDISNFDFSGLTVWQANLQEKKLHNVNFTGADLSKSVFTETFGNILSATFSPDGTILATCDTDCQIRLWEVATGKLLVICKGHNNWVRSVSFSPDGRTIASGSADRTVKFWLVKDGSCIKTCRGHKNEVFSVAFSPDNQSIVSASGDNILRIWDFRTGKCLGTCNGHSNWVRSVAFSPDGQTLASGSSDRTVRIWDWKNNRCIHSLSGHEDLVCGVAFHPDNQTVASGSRDNTVRLSNLSTGKCCQILEGHEDWVYAVAFSPDGTTLASGGADKTARIWNYQTGRCLQTVSGHGDQVWSVAFSPDGKTLATSSTDRQVRLWDVATGKSWQTLTGHLNRIKSVAFSPQNSNLLASGSTDNTVIIWDTGQGKPLKTLEGHDNWVFAVAISPDGRTIASASHDRTVRLWDLETGECRHICQGHQHLVSSVAFHPNGQIIVSGSQDQTVRLWDVNTGKCLQVLQADRLYEGMNITRASGT
ncbi:WD40 domain-containing protein [Myxosarcina sp. GI1(2024)]